MEARKACKDVKNRYENGLCELNGIIPCEKNCLKEEAEKYLSWIARDKLGQIKIDGWSKIILIQKGQLFIDHDRENRWTNKKFVFEDLKKEIFEYIEEGHKIEIEGFGYWLTL